MYTSFIGDVYNNLSLLKTLIYIYMRALSDIYMSQLNLEKKINKNNNNKNDAFVRRVYVHVREEKKSLIKISSSSLSLSLSL